MSKGFKCTAVLLIFALAIAAVFVNRKTAVAARALSRISPLPVGAKNLFVVKTAATGLDEGSLKYLALVPVSKHINNGTPAVLTVPDEGALTNDVHVQDFMARYRPDRIFTVDLDIDDDNYQSVAPDSLTDFTVKLAARCWEKSTYLFLAACTNSVENYSRILEASSLASMYDAPLVYYEHSRRAMIYALIKKMEIEHVVFVGDAGKSTLHRRHIENTDDAIKHVEKRDINYLVITNPGDVGNKDSSKISLVSAIVAARRGGLVVPLSVDSDAVDHLAMVKEIYQRLPATPEYVALVGNHESIPLAVYKGGHLAEDLSVDLATDFDYANVDDDAFPDIAIGRILADNIHDASLLTSRISTYEELANRGRNTFAELGATILGDLRPIAAAYNYAWADFSEVGVNRENVRIEASILKHFGDSTCSRLGGHPGSPDIFDTASSNVLAPSLFVTGGPASGAIQDQDGNNLVATRILKMGAVGYFGGTGPMVGDTAVSMEILFITGVLAGNEIGKAFQDVLSAYSIHTEHSDYAVLKKTVILLGDPALKLRTTDVSDTGTRDTVTHAARVSPESECEELVTVKLPSKRHVLGVTEEGGVYSSAIPGAYVNLSPMGVRNDSSEKAINTYLVKHTVDSRRQVARVERLDTGEAIHYSVNNNPGRSTADIYWHARLAPYWNPVGPDFAWNAVKNRPGAITYSITYSPAEDE